MPLPSWINPLVPHKKEVAISLKMHCEPWGFQSRIHIIPLMLFGGEILT